MPHARGHLFAWAWQIGIVDGDYSADDWLVRTHSMPRWFYDELIACCLARDPKDRRVVCNVFPWLG